MAIPFWYHTTTEQEDIDKAKNTDFVNGYNCKGTGLLFILFGCLAALIMQGMKVIGSAKTEYWILNIITLVVLSFGGFLYLIGSFVIAGSLGKLYKGSSNNDWHTYQTLQVSDGFFIFFLSSILGLDIWRNYLALSVRLRSVVAINTTYLFVSFLDFFAFGGLSNKTATDLTRAVAAGFFFVLLGGSILYALEFVDVCCKCLGSIQLYAMKLRLRLLLLVSVAFYLFGTFVVDCGLWAIVNHNSFPSQNNAAIVGMTVLFTFVSIFVALDVSLGEYVNSMLGKKGTEPQQKPPAQGHLP